MSWGADCPTQRVQTRGIWVRNSVNTGRAQPFAAATVSFDAPSGTSIVSFSAQYSLHRDDTYWHVGLFADSSMLVGCPANQTNVLCTFSTAWPGTTSTWNWADGVHKVYIQVACGSPVWCSTQAAAAPFTERAAVRLFSAVVRVRDDSAPAVWSVDGALAGDSWLRGSHFIGYASSDNVGIRATRFYVDGALRDDLQRDCDFTQRVPCSNLTYARYGLDTQALPDGDHEIKVESVDTAGNAKSFAHTIHADNHAPDAPDAVAVEGGEGWRQANSFHLTWNQPSSAAPVTVAHYELCNTSNSTCTAGERRGDGIAAISDLAVPEPGDYTVRLWLEDAAGNVNPANRSLPVHVRFDNVPPGEASPRKWDGWLGAAEAKSVEQAIDMKPGEFVPVSSVAGYSVTTDGSEPDASLDVAGDTYRAGALPEGITTFKARAISGSGVPSDKVGMTLIQVDRTPPTADATGIPGAGWQRAPIRLHVTGVDQAGLSGMAGAQPEAPLEQGAFVSHRVDGGEIQRVRGNDAEVTVSADGEHTVTYSATDVAGNESPQGTARVRIDSTPPELVVFEAPTPGDPRRVEVAASDRTSGVATGTVEVRRLDSHSASNDGWTELKTIADGDHFAATIDDERLPQGVYELRARVTDNAGNEATGDRRRDGSVASVDTVTLRTGTKLVAGLVPPATKPKRSCTRRHGRKKKRCKTTAAPRAGGLVPTLIAPFGTAVSAQGTLVAGGGGPVPGAAIEVYEKPVSAGSGLKLVDHLLIDGIPLLRAGQGDDDAILKLLHT